MLAAIADGTLGIWWQGVGAGAGCGPCFGGHGGLLAPGERCIGTHNRLRQRMGSQQAGSIWHSPATVAASAIAGTITDPRSMEVARG